LFSDGKRRECVDWERYKLRRKHSFKEILQRIFSKCSNTQLKFPYRLYFRLFGLIGGAIPQLSGRVADDTPHNERLFVK
jgi:hypothetical protein